MRKETKYIWEESDIEAGLYVIRNDCPKNTINLGFASTVAFKIGYIMTCCKEDGLRIIVDSKNQYGISNFLTDGWFLHIGSKQEVVEHLNSDLRGYRPMTKKEIVRIINYSSKGFIKKQK